MNDVVKKILADMQPTLENMPGREVFVLRGQQVHAVKEALEKQIPRWHDLQKNIDDLPTDNTDKLVYTDEGSYAVAFYSKGARKWYFYNPDINRNCDYIESCCVNVDAWKEIESYEVSE